jgi:molecular chaperone DnaK
MPKVERAVAEFFGREPSKGVHPDEVVAVGAGIQGSALSEDVTADSRVVLLDVTPQTLGMMVAGGLFEPLIPKDTTVPTLRSKSFTTSRDNQTAVKILVMQGENDQADKNELLGEFILTGLRRAPAGAIEIEVTFEINADGIVSVHAKDLETGKEQSITVTATSGLTQEELKDMIDSGEQYAVERKRDEEFEAKRQEAEGLMLEIEGLFEKVQRIVGGSDYGRDALEKARNVIQKASSSIERHDTPALKEQTEALSRTLRMFKGVVQKA